jgi:hypothetical protein
LERLVPGLDVDRRRFGMMRTLKDKGCDQVLTDRGRCMQGVPRPPIYDARATVDDIASIESRRSDQLQLRPKLTARVVITVITDA